MGSRTKEIWGADHLKGPKYAVSNKLGLVRWSLRPLIEDKEVLLIPPIPLRDDAIFNSPLQSYIECC